MDNLTLLSPSALADYIATIELPFREKEGFPEAGQIFRYGACVASAIQVYPTLGRTMNKAREYIISQEESGKSIADGRVIIASSLSLSKGRFSRSWHAPSGGLWGCLVLADTILPLFKNFLPLIPGIACCEALQQFGVNNATIRWVNDVLVQNKKQAGFLIEGFHSPVHGEGYQLLGFGLNINNTVFPVELQDTAISLAQLAGHPVDIVSFSLSFLAKLRYYIGLLFYEEKQWLSRGGGEEYEDEHPIIKRWKELSNTVGQEVFFGNDVLQCPQYKAKAIAITTDGGLMLQHDDGEISVEYSGEIRY